MSGVNNSGVTQLEFHQAMCDFKNMFPEVEEDVIETILRSNNGIVDATIDQLLQMNDNESRKKKALPLKQDNVSILNIRFKNCSSILKYILV